MYLLENGRGIWTKRERLERTDMKAKRPSINTQRGNDISITYAKRVALPVLARPVAVAAERGGDLGLYRWRS